MTHHPHGWMDFGSAQKNSVRFFATNVRQKGIDQMIERKLRDFHGVIERCSCARVARTGAFGALREGSEKSTKIVHRSEFFAGGAPKRHVSVAPVHEPR